MLRLRQSDSARKVSGKPGAVQYTIRLKLRKKWLNDYNEHLRKLDLTINEIDLLEELSSFLIDPYHKMLLLKNRNTFQKALSMGRKEGGIKSKYADSLLKKTFYRGAIETPEDFEHVNKSGRPARFVTPDGSVYSGRLNKGQEDTMILGNVKQLEIKETSGLGRLFVQDYRGISSYSVSEYKRSDNNLLRLTLTPEEKSKKNYPFQIFMLFRFKVVHQ